MYKLDQLCNAHFTPKPVSLSTSTAKANVSSMTIEEAVPLAVSTAAMTAPSEIRRGDTVKVLVQTPSIMFVFLCMDDRVVFSL